MVFSRYSPLGLDLGSNYIKIVQLKRAGPRVILQNYRKIKTPRGAIKEGKIQDPQGLIKCLRAILRRNFFRGNKVISSLGGEGVVLKRLTLPALKGKELRKAVKYEGERQLSTSLDKFRYDYMVLGPPKEEESQQIEVLLVAVPGEVVQGYMDVICRGGFFPLALEVDVLALMRNYYYTRSLGSQGSREEGESMALLDLGVDNSTMVFLEGDRYSFSWSIPVGGDHLVQKAAGLEDLPGEVVEPRKDREDFLELEGGQRPLEEMVREIGRCLDMYSYQGEDREIPVSRLLISGDNGNIPCLSRHIEEKLGLKVSTLDLAGLLKINPGVEPHDLAQDKTLLNVAMGLALGGWKCGKH